MYVRAKATRPLEECIPGKPAAAPVIAANSIRAASAAELLRSERRRVFARSNTAGLIPDLIESKKIKRT